MSWCTDSFRILPYKKGWIKWRWFEKINQSSWALWEPSRRNLASPLLRMMTRMKRKGKESLPFWIDGGQPRWFCKETKTPSWINLCPNDETYPTWMLMHVISCFVEFMFITVVPKLSNKIVYITFGKLELNYKSKFFLSRKFSFFVHLTSNNLGYVLKYSLRNVA